MLPPGEAAGLECIVIVDDRYAATYRFHDVPRPESRGFVTHLGPRHGFTRILLVSGDRDAEVRRLAQLVAITETHASTAPEEKVEIVRRETRLAKTLFVGDGINDAPALMAATVGVAFGQQSDVTSEAARVVVVDTSMSKVDELLHISRRLRRIALQSAIGGMVISVGGHGVRRVGIPVARGRRPGSGRHRSAGRAQRAPHGARAEVAHRSVFVTVVVAGFSLPSRRT